MEKECIINPKTGRAVVVKGKIGRQILKKQGKTTAKVAHTMYSKPIGPVRPTEPKTAKPSATRPRLGRPKKPTEPTTAKPSATRPRPKKVNTDKQIEPKIMVNTMYSKPIGPVKPKKEANTMYSKPIGPVKPKTQQPTAPKTEKVNSKAILKAINDRIGNIYEMSNTKEFIKNLSNIKDKQKMKEYSDDYIGNLASEIQSISIAVKGLPESVKKRFKPDTQQDLYALNKYGTLDDDFNPLRILKAIFEEEYNNRK